MSIGHGLGGALGPWYGGYVYDRLGSYTLAFLVALLALCGVIVCFRMATRRLVIPRAASTAQESAKCGVRSAK